MNAPRIVVVDDEQIVAASLRKRLQSQGYEVPALAATGEEAIELIGRLGPDLVLMDIRLEGEMDGVEAAALIRSRFRIPVIFLTAYSNQAVLDRAKVTEPYGYILKPFEERELHVVVEIALYKHKMERLLEERERWFSATLKSIGDGVVATDRDGQVIFLNPMAEQLTGWTSQEATGTALEKVLHLVHEETRQSVEAPLLEAIRAGISLPIANHTLLIARDRSERPIDDCASPITDDAGISLGGVIVFRDVSERKRTEERQRQSQRFNQAVLDSLPAHVAVLDGTGAVIALNEGHTRFASDRGGYLRPGLGENFLDACRGAVGTGSAELLAAAAGIEAVLAGSTLRFSLEYRWPPGGEEQWFLLVAVPLHQDEGRAIVTHTDVTDRKKAEQTASKLSAIVECSHDAIYGWNPDGTITSWNAGAERLYGYTAAEITGRPFSILFPEDSGEELHSIVERIRQGEKLLPFEALRRRKDGKLVDALVSISPVKDPAGRVIGAAAIAHDITPVKALESRYRQAQKMEAIGRLAGGIAHDFNNLLTVINGYSEILVAALRDNDPGREMAEQINQAGERAASLTQQLLAYSRKQIQKLKILNLNEQLANIEKLLRRTIGADIDLATFADPALCAIKADASQVEQILMNLAVNARDAMPTGGKLTITTKNLTIDEADTTGLFQIAPGPYVLLTVTDTGVGIDEETQTHIFEPFFTTKGVGKGTGLGLATVYGIVKQSEGYIKVFSKPGLGTTFQIFLPSLTDPVRHEAPVDRDLPGGTETVLMAEDEPALRSLTEHLLRKFGYTVLVASDGVEALAVAAGYEGPIDLLVTDVVMPNMGGPQLAAVLMRARPLMRVLYLSGYTDDAVLRHGVMGAHTAYLQKPFTLSELAHKVREVLQSERS